MTTTAFIVMLDAAIVLGIIVGGVLSAILKVKDHDNS